MDKQGENCLEVDLPDQSKAIAKRTQRLSGVVVKLRIDDISSDKEGFEKSDDGIDNDLANESDSSSFNDLYIFD